MSVCVDSTGECECAGGGAQCRRPRCAASPLWALRHRMHLPAAILSILFHIEDGFARGPGVLDMKCGVAPDLLPSGRTEALRLS